MENIRHENESEKKAEVAILLWDKIHIKTKTTTIDKEGHYVIIKGTIQQEGITVVNIYAPNMEVPKYIKYLLTDQREKLTVIQ